MHTPLAECQVPKLMGSMIRKHTPAVSDQAIFGVRAPGNVVVPAFDPGIFKTHVHASSACGLERVQQPGPHATLTSQASVAEGRQ